MLFKVPNGLRYVENLAYDWIAKNLYFTHSDRISVVAYNNPKQRRDVIHDDNIIALAVDPNAGYLFYSSMKRPAKIIRTYLDGSNRKVIAQQGLWLPYAITIDYQGFALFSIMIFFLIAVSFKFKYLG